MHIAPFAVEEWMNEWENHCRFNLAETCIDSITVDELLELSPDPGSVLTSLRGTRLDYGAITGSQELRELIAGLYTGRSADEVLITHGAAGANAMVHQTLLGTGDHVISILPSYQQHYSIPESLGANVTRIATRPEDDWLPRIEEIRAAVTEATKLIVLTNPNNPTGALIAEPGLLQIVEVAASVDAWVLVDEVYRGTDRPSAALTTASATESGYTTSITDLCAKGISTGSMSKAYSLAGLRLGWITADAELLSRAMIHRDYSTISVGVIDDALARIALTGRDRLLARNHSIIETNFANVDAFVKSRPELDWVAPLSGTTALISYDVDRPEMERTASYDYCRDLLSAAGVMMTPGDAFEIPATVRIGYCPDPADLLAGLDAWAGYLDRRSRA